ncbi:MULTISPECIES: glutathione S-transferase family protein [unclassified Bradyrhizobium]|uniref:glutathione S-transferase family protein n=1 Tax=unclassified Bradyrhizobium TaxID=2631580 RepID=UPI0023060DD5|nr:MULTISPECIES: glutathione S-transferase family protein [unclassified Bradyrhizobium]MDA9451235.1 glutathione S-transferase [Bradyrhizobium sp. CCBAU 21360]MDA9457614.1 glutathione S-transferase [Bradyrhizobium sp. CCBAU 21359]
MSASTNDEFALYCRGESGNCYKVALMLNLCGLAWHPRFVNFFDEKSKPAFRKEVSDMGELPVLEGRGFVLSQSGVILNYLSETTGRFGGRNDEERREILRWMLFDNHRFTPSYATLRFMKGIRKVEDNPVTEWLHGQATIAFDIAEHRLGQHPFVAGDSPTIADISMCGYQYYDEASGIDRGRYPNIGSWLERIAALPGWAHPYDIMPRAIPSADRPGPAALDKWP